jgi:hypothetical protein
MLKDSVKSGIRQTHTPLALRKIASRSNFQQIILSNSNFKI